MVKMSEQCWDIRSYEFGEIALLANHQCLMRVCFKATRREAIQDVRSYFPDAAKRANSIIQTGFIEINEYFSGQRQKFNLPLELSRLSTFSQNILTALGRVPYGSLVSYRGLAAMAGCPKAARAVGRVMSSNPFPILIPCHRVISASGGLGQYSGGYGAKTKTQLIDLERTFKS